MRPTRTCWSACASELRSRAVSEPEFEKPKPPKRYLTVRELRPIVSARHKYLCASKPVEDGIALITEEYGADEESSLIFVTWLRGGEASEPPTKNTAIERTHISTDPETGEESLIHTQPGSIPPKPV